VVVVVVVVSGVVDGGRAIFNSGLRPYNDVVVVWFVDISGGRKMR
jgi:hypothetical protein